MLAVVADIAIKAAVLNPHYGEAVLRETFGIVLLDEIDLQVIGETPAGQIIVLRQDGSWFKPDASLGLNSNEVLRDIMGANYVSRAFAEKLAELDTLLANAEFEVARNVLNVLRNEFPNVPEFDCVDAYMDRMDAIADEDDSGNCF